MRAAFIPEWDVNFTYAICAPPSNFRLPPSPSSGGRHASVALVDWAADPGAGASSGVVAFVTSGQDGDTALEVLHLGKGREKRGPTHALGDQVPRLQESIECLLARVKASI